MNRRRMIAIARTDLRKLRRSPDFWIPMALMAGLFFVGLPAVLLLTVSLVEQFQGVQEIGSALAPLQRVDPQAVEGVTGADQTSYSLALYLFAPLAVVVPMTISSAIGANTLVGERERGTGEFLAHSPVHEREIYLGKLIASLVPGYVATVVGFGLYALVVNTIVGPRVGRWFFPTLEWLVLVFWVVPPFLALAVSVILRVSGRVKSSVAAQQASGLVTLPLILFTYTQSSLNQLGTESAFFVGLVAWLLALLGLWRGSKSVTRPRLLGVDNV